MKDEPGAATTGNRIAIALRSRTDARYSRDAPSTPSVWLSNCPMVICDLRGSLFHSVIVSETGSSSLNKPSRVAASAATPQKLLVPLKIGHPSRADPPCTNVTTRIAAIEVNRPYLQAL